MERNLERPAMRREKLAGAETKSRKHVAVRTLCTYENLEGKSALMFQRDRESDFMNPKISVLRKILLHVTPIIPGDGDYNVVFYKEKQDIYVSCLNMYERLANFNFTEKRYKMFGSKIKKNILQNR